MRNEIKRYIKTYSIAITIPLAIGFVSAFLTRNNMRIYSEFQTPPFAPPAILFPIVWTVLYILMGISSAMIWINRKKDPQTADAGLSFYAVSLAFNFIWSILFFNFRWILFAFFWLVTLGYLIIRTILSYQKISPAAAYLQIPYIIWVAFAGYLNLGIWFGNR